MLIGSLALVAILGGLLWIAIVLLVVGACRSAGRAEDEPAPASAPPAQVPSRPEDQIGRAVPSPTASSSPTA